MRSSPRACLPLIAALLLPFAALAGPKPALPSDLDDFDAYVESVRAEFDVPGIAVAIVKDGEPVLVRGWGERELGKGEAVDGGTLFAIASNTKAFTAAALSMLADEGKRLAMQFAHTPQLLGDLEHWQHDSFIVRWRDRSLNADAFASFALAPDGKVRELRLEAISPLTDFSFDFHDLRLTPTTPEAD